MLDTGARGSTTTFVQRGIGDVLLAWENEAHLAIDELGRDKVEIVIPSFSILAEPPVAVVDKVVDRRGTRPLAEAYLRYLYTEEGQEIAAKRYYRPRLASVAAKYAAAVPEARPGDDRQPVRRLGGGAGEALRRRRRLRPDLPAGPVARCAASTGSIPGFGQTLGFSLTYLSLLVLIPLAALVLKAGTLSWDQFLAAVTAPRVLASYQLSLGASAVAALVNGVFGVLVAWVLVRYPFPGRRLVDAMVDLPFALPTAVAGIALTAIYAENGWVGRILASVGIKGAFSPLGVTIALIFIGLPFVVRTVQPVLRDLGPELEEAAASLGAGRWQTFRRVLLPMLLPSIVTGMALAFARAVGEYGSVVFISGNMPLRTEITPLIIITKLEQFDYAGAAAVAVVLLAISFVLLLAINGLQVWTARRLGPG